MDNDNPAQPSATNSSTPPQPSIHQRHQDLVDPSVYVFCEDVSKYEKISKIGQGSSSKYS